MKKLFLLLLAAVALIAAFEANLLFNKNHDAKSNLVQNVVAKETSHDQNDSCCVMTNATSSELSGNSIYQTESKWRNQESKTVNISGLRGKVEVIAMFYSHCTYACPLTINDMKRIEISLPPALHGKVGFVLVSFDPKRDTPQALKTLSQQQQLNRSGWSLLTGNSGDIRTLAAVLGVEFKREANGDFIHSNQITVLNKRGEIVYKHFGLNQPISDVVQAVAKSSLEN